MNMQKFGIRFIRFHEADGGSLTAELDNEGARDRLYDHITADLAKANERIAELTLMAKRKFQYDAELYWIDMHLFADEPVNLQASRDFCIEDTIEVKRTLRICDLLEAEQRVTTLTDELAIKTNAYNTWYQRCLVVEAELATARAALRPFADDYRRVEGLWTGAELLEMRPKGFPTLLTFGQFKQAAAALCDGDKEANDEKAES